MPISTRRARVATAPILLTLLAAPIAQAGAAPVHELIEPGVVRSFASPSDAANAEASVALIANPSPIGPAPVGFAPLPEFSEQNGLRTVTVPVEPGTNLYATGSQSGPLERTGRRVEYYNLDNYAWGDSSNRNYQTHPWVLGVRADGSAFGVLFDSTWRSSLDTQNPLDFGIVFQTEGPTVRVITIDAASPQEVVMKLADLTGKPFMPPMWSLGYHQSKYSYTPQSYALSIAQEFRNRQIPAEVIWLDIDYMNGFRNFTFNASTFPDPAALNASLDAIGFQAVWMANCGIKVDNAYDAYTQMTALTLATQRANLSPFVGQVWPGSSVWPDFTMQATRDWWAGRIAQFAAIGVDGIWNDMNEPAVFNVASKTMPDDNWHRADPELGGPGEHRRYHNIYGMQMSRATRDGMLQAFPSRRPFVLTRAGYIGGQRYAAMWTGDNVANWYHVDVSIQNILNIGLSGQPNCGPDIGGFNGDSGALMYARWMGLGALMPFARGHYGFSSIQREPWSYGASTENTCRLALNRRYRLLNYLYTLFHEAHTTGMPVARPLFFAEPDNPGVRFWDDGFLLGPGLLVVGATAPGAVPQVPPTETPLYRFGFPQAPGAAPDTQTADLPRLYALGGHIIVSNDIVQHSRELSSTRAERLILIVALDENGAASGVFYEDDGDGFDYESGAFTRATFTAQRIGNNVTVSLASLEGNLPLLGRTISVRVLRGGGAETVFSGNSAALPFTFAVPANAPDHQPDPNLRDGRLIAQRFGPTNLLATNDAPRYSEISQLRALYAFPTETGLEIGIEGELAIDGTAIALFLDGAPGGQSIINTSSLAPPPGGLSDLTGTDLDPGFVPDKLLFANAADGTVYCDWVTLTQGGSGSKLYLGREFLGSGDDVLTDGNNSPGLRVALGSAGHAANSGFEIFVPYTALGTGTGPLNEIKLFAAIVKPWGALTNQTLPPSSDNWLEYAPDLTAVAGDQFATVLNDPDLDGDDRFTIDDLYFAHQNPLDANNDGAVNDADSAHVEKFLRRTEPLDAGAP